MSSMGRSVPDVPGLMSLQERDIVIDALANDNGVDLLLKVKKITQHSLVYHILSSVFGEDLDDTSWIKKDDIINSINPIKQRYIDEIQKFIEYRYTLQTKETTILLCLLRTMGIKFSKTQKMEGGVRYYGYRIHKPINKYKIIKTRFHRYQRYWDNNNQNAKQVQRRYYDKLRDKRGGYVYLLQSPTKMYKIGFSKNPKNRLKTFGVKLPFEVEYIALIGTIDMVGLERQLHQRFADKRINGEWFELSPEDVSYIKGLQS